MSLPCAEEDGQNFLDLASSRSGHKEQSTQNGRDRCWIWLRRFCATALVAVQVLVLVAVFRSDSWPVSMCSIQWNGVFRRDVGGTTVLQQTSQPAALPHYDLLIIIPASGSRNRANMDTVRQTWAQEINSTTGLCDRCQSQRTIKYFFVLGDEATEEEKANPHLNGEGTSDVIALPRCSSDYGRLADKVRKAMHFVVKHYSFRLLLKTDTDSWVFLDTLLAFAEKNDLFNRPSVHAGDIKRQLKPQPPDSGGKNVDQVFPAWTGQDTYPVFASGCGYMLTHNLCSYIALLAEDSHLPRLVELPPEDVSVGFWLQALQHEKLSMPISVYAGGCGEGMYEGLRTILVLDHYLTDAEMHRRARNLREYGNPCGKLREGAR